MENQQIQWSLNGLSIGVIQNPFVLVTVVLLHLLKYSSKWQGKSLNLFILFPLIEFIVISSDYPCDLPSVLTLTLTNVGSPRMHIHELALRLMVVLCKGHLSESQPNTSPQSNGISSSDDIAYIISLASNYSKSQMMLSEYLARRRPDLTMAMFSGKMSYSIHVNIMRIFVLY